MDCLKVIAAAFLTCGIVSAGDLIGKLPSHVKLIQGVAPNQESPAAENRNVSQAGRERRAQRAQEAARGRCAHILVYPSDPRVDPGIQMAPGGQSVRVPGTMPVHPGLPVCAADIRQPVLPPQPQPERVPNVR